MIVSNNENHKESCQSSCNVMLSKLKVNDFLNPTIYIGKDWQKVPKTKQELNVSEYHWLNILSRTKSVYLPADAFWIIVTLHENDVLISK